MLKVGLVGAGFMARMHAECLRWIPEACITGVTGGGPERAQEFAAKYGCAYYPNLEALLSEGDPDMVDLCTPTDLHPSQALTAAAAGRHIFCEKPIALTLEDAEAMIQACRAARVKFMVAQVLRFWPEYTAIHELATSGRLGKVLWASARRFTYSPNWAKEGWHRDPCRSGGGVLDLHIHDLDYLSWILGPPKTIYSQGSRGPGGGLDTVFTTGSGHPNGAVSFAAGSNNLPSGFKFNSAMLIALEKGSIGYDSGLTPSHFVFEPDKEPYCLPLPQAPVPEGVEVGGNITDLGGYFFELRYFVNCILQDREPEIITPQEAKQSLALCLAARRSAERGEAVEVIPA
jgi:UDP-N-acetylglucosamine 3-dehydrogenase